MSETSRRAVLAGVAGITAAALAACAGEAENPAPAGNDGGAAEPGAGSPTGATGSGNGSGSSNGSGSGSGALATTSAIPVGGGKVFKEQKVVVTQPKAGDFKAFSVVCPHQGCAVDSVADGKIACPCHKSFFSAADGSVISGPAQKGLAPARITVDGTAIKLG